MTPNLLDELEGVVRLMEAATQGEWYWNEHTANLVTDHPDDGQEFEIAAVYSEHDDDREPANSAAICAAVNFLRTHAPALADMAKRMEAAERDAKRWRFMRAEMALGRSDVFAAMNAAIPDGAPDVRDVIEGYLDSGIDAAIDATQEGEAS